MSSKKTKKGSKSDKAKRNVQTVGKAPGRHSKEEIISEEELDNRIAIDGDIRLYLTMYLKIFIDGHFRHPKKKKLINMAQYIYDQKVLYIHKHDGYKLMEFSSIHAELAALKKPVEEEYMKEKRRKTAHPERSRGFAPGFRPRESTAYTSPRQPAVLSKRRWPRFRLSEAPRKAAKPAPAGA